MHHVRSFARRYGLALLLTAAASIVTYASGGVMALLAFVISGGIIAFVASGFRAGRGNDTRNEALFRTVIESTNDVTSVLDANGRNTYVSHSVLRVLGYTQAERMGRSSVELIHADDRAATQAMLDRLAAQPGETLSGFEFRVRARDGEWRLFENTGTNLLHNPAVRGVVLHSRDVTERRAAERRIRLQARLLDAVAQAVVFTDAEERIVYWNRGARELYGWTAEDVVGRHIDALALFLGDTPEHLAAARSAVRAGARWSGEMTVQRRDGNTIPVFVTNSPFAAGAGEPAGVVSVALDITDRKRGEAALRVSEEKLHLAQKLEAVGRLAGGVAHDFNNLLTSIDGFTQLALDALPPDSETRADLEEVKRSAARASALTHQLLAFSRKQVLQPRVLDVNAVVRDMQKMLRRLIGEDIRLEARLEAVPGRIRADVGQVEQVIVNLSVNARDAMPRGGRLTIATANAELTEEDAGSQPFEVRPGPYVSLIVSDTGTGMTRETLEHLFEPFYTTKELGRGTGLGLSTVYGIIKQSGGYVWVDTEPDIGTTVRIYLPRVDAPLTAAGPGDAARPRRGSETVLLVEDDEMVRALARRVLARQGYAVLEARNGVEALRIAERFEQPLDLVLTDVVMPELGGRELVERLAAIRPDVPVLMMSGYTDDAIVRYGITRAGDQFLPKPFTTAALAQKVRDVLDAMPAA